MAGTHLTKPSGALLKTARGVFSSWCRARGSLLKKAISWEPEDGRNSFDRDKFDRVCQSQNEFERRERAALRWKERLSSIPYYQDKDMDFWRAFQNGGVLGD